MPTPDGWEEAQSSRREAKRYRARWKVALVFDGTPGKPMFKTLTHDLSMNGTSLQCDTNEKLNAVLTLLLRLPPMDGIPPRVVKLKSVVMSSMPFRGGFRLGLSFIQDSELDKLRAILGTLDLSGDSLPSDPEGDELPKLLL
ncbi:MAG: PilZ domain-containing protein [Sulfuritalea sp.]|nr:PilZ domain-containing protein [Sulfuritalea sp.]